MIAMSYGFIFVHSHFTEGFFFSVTIHSSLRASSRGRGRDLGGGEKLVVLGGSNWKVSESCDRAMAGFPRILFGGEKGNLKYVRLGLIKWLMYSPRKTLRGKLLVRYQRLTLRFDVNVDFLFLNKYLG